MKCPYILVLHEKYGAAFFLMKNEADVLDFAIKTLEQRYLDGYYHVPKKPPATFNEFFKSVHGISASEATEMTKKYGENVRLGNRTPANEIISTKSAYVYAISEYKEYADIEAAISSSNSREAWRILCERSSEGHPHETFTMERIENMEQSNE